MTNITPKLEIAVNGLGLFIKRILNGKLTCLGFAEAWWSHLPSVPLEAKKRLAPLGDRVRFKAKVTEFGSLKAKNFNFLKNSFFETPPLDLYGKKFFTI